MNPTAASSHLPNNPAIADPREWMPQDGSATRRSLVVMGARIRQDWLNRSVDVVRVRFAGDLAQALGDLVALASAKRGKSLPTSRLKASLALALDGIILIDRQLGLNPERSRPAIELYVEDVDQSILIENIRSCLKTWNNDVVQPWAQANGFAEAAERLSTAIVPAGIVVTPTTQLLVERSEGARLGKPAYHLIARRLAEELVGATLFAGMSPVDLVVDPTNTTASVELLTQPTRMERTRGMFSMAARLSVFTMPNSRDLFVKVTPVKRIWSADLPGRKPNAPSSVTCTVMVPGKPFMTVKAVRSKVKSTVGQEAEASPWRFGEEYEEFLYRSAGNLPATLKDAVANLAPDQSKGGWWVGLPRLTTLFDRIGGRTVFERDEYDLHETVVQMLPWALDPKIEMRRVKAIAQKAAADATHTALRPSDIGQSEDALEPGRAGQALHVDDASDEDLPLPPSGQSEQARLNRLAEGRASNVLALKALYPNRSIHLFVFGGEENEQAIIRACAGVLFGDAVKVHTEALPMHTQGLRAELEQSAASGLVRFNARVARWEAAFKQLPDDGGVRHVLICADRLIGRRLEDPVNYYAAIHAACRIAGANVHHVLPVQQKRGKADVGHFVHRVQSAMLDVFLAHSGVILGVRDLVAQTIGQSEAPAGSGTTKYVFGVQALRSRARARSAESDVTFILYSRLSLQTGLVSVRITCRIGKKDVTSDWMDLASGLRWLGSQRQIESDEVWIKASFQQQTRSVLAQLKAEDEHAIVLIDWDRLKNLWPALRDESLCESAPGALMLGNADLALACPNMTFVRLRSSRETSMTMRLLVTKLYQGWISNGQAYESTGEVYTERYLGPAHEIVEIVDTESKERSRPGRINNRHYLQVMRYRRTVQLQRGYSCYRISERIKKIDGLNKSADAALSKRYRLVKFDPAHEDAALPATTELTIVAGPGALDTDQVVRLTMGLRLRYAHYPDWTALPAPLFFISKVDDYVIPYVNLLDDEMDADAPGVAEEAADDVSAAVEPLTSEPLSAGEIEPQAETNHDTYFDDVTRAISEQLPQLQLFSPGESARGDNQGMETFDTTSGSAAERLSIDTSSSESDKDGQAGVPSEGDGQGSEGSSGDKTEQQRDEARCPKDQQLAKAWSLIQDVPCLFSVRDANVKRLYEDMLREQVRIAVDLPWFVKTSTVVPPEAWPDHKAINKYWRQQGNMGLRLANKPAPTTSDFKSWLMRRLRMPQSSWSVNGSQLFKNGARVFDVVFKRYEALLEERAAEGQEPPEVLGGNAFNCEALAQWLCKRDDDEGIAWLVTMAAHWPNAYDVERIFEALDGRTLGPMTSCALEYLVDCCEVAIQAAKTTVAERRGMAAIHRKRDPKWEALAAPTQQSESLPAQNGLDAKSTASGEHKRGDAVRGRGNSAGKRPDTANPGKVSQTDELADRAGAMTAQLTPASTQMPSSAIDTQAAHSAEADPDWLAADAHALLKAMAEAVTQMSPGSDDFGATAEVLRSGLQRMHDLHVATLRARAQVEHEQQGQEERELAERTMRTVRQQVLERFFDELIAACASIPAELSQESHKVPGSTESWLPYALSLPQTEFAAWMHTLHPQLASAKEAVSQILTTHQAFETLDNGTDERLTNVSGLARRQLQHKLQDELIVAANEANDGLSTALSSIARLGPQGDNSVLNPAIKGHSNSAQPALEGKTADDAVSGTQVASAGSNDLGGSEEQSSGVAGSSSPQSGSSPGAANVAVSHAEPAVPPPTNMSSSSQDASSAVVDSLLVESDSPVNPIELDIEFDVRSIDQHLQPMQQAADDRLWKLTKVGVAALCAVHPHLTVEVHGLVWLSMLKSLSATTSVGAEQRLNEKLLKWLETDQQGVGEDSGLAFALDVGILGAGLLPILFEGHEARVRWAVLGRVSARLKDHKPLHELCEHLQSLDSGAISITRENLSASRVGPRKALEAEVLRQRERAGRWPDDQALFTNWPNPEYWDMHRAIFEDRHGMQFHKALQHVVRGSDDGLRKMMPELHKYVDKIAGTLADLRKRTGRKRPLEGPHADKLAQNIATTLKFLEHYLSVRERLSSEASNDTPKPLRDFLDQLHTKTQAAQRYLTEITAVLADDGSVLRLHATLARQVLQSTELLMNEQALQPPVAESDQVLLMDLPLSSAQEPVWSVQLEPADEEALLRDPLVVISEVRSVQQQIAQMRQSRPQQSVDDLLVSAADMHRKNAELLAARFIEQRVRSASPQVLSQMQSSNDAAHRRQKNQLGEELSDARQRVTNALSVGPMTQTEASRMLKVIEVLDRANRESQIGAIGLSPTPFEDFPQARAILRLHVLEPLEQRIHESLRSLENDVVVYREKLDRMGEAERARKVEQLDRIMAGLAEVTPTNLRVARYSFSLLEQDQLPFIKLSAANASQQYELFQKSLRSFASNHSSLESLRDALRGGDKHWPKGQKPTWADPLSDEQRADAASFLDAWINLTEARSFSDIHDPLAAFFTAAGTVEAPTAMNEPGSTNRTPFHLPAKTFVGSARLQNFWVPPTLGSAARDLRGVVLRHRPAPELMAQIIGELPMSSPTFVLGRTHLSLERRSAITRDHPVIIVDDDLVAYMAVHPEQRLAKMMEVGLLTFHDNPYDDYGGPVPSEMFFGRRAELLRLNANKSAMVLYGGRRLGKSSLLDRIQFESRQNLVRTDTETRGEVAIYIPLESRIDSAVFGEDHKLFAWMGIYRGMVSNEFIKPATREPKTAEGLREHIRSAIMAGEALTNACYLLIDEADEVMARDLDSSGAFATSLRGLADDVRDVCQIRYVIAGLHNLTRMHTEGNTALAKADAIALQPFSAGQDILMGVELITKPLAALGFVFPKSAEDLPMRILAMCNFYPAFVQLYCKNLILDLYNKRGSSSPVTQIDASDLDKVERNKDFIGVMQEKFRYNLDLDKRYKAIALVLAETYYSGNGAGVEHGLPASEIRDLCQLLFPNHFSKTGEGAFPALLDEMEKLTVIDRKGGRFQLRTPHIATMMGSRDDVNHKIDELSRETALAHRIPGETRSLLIMEGGNESKLFPMPSGWVRQLLHEEERGLTVLVGNHLSGLAEIEPLRQSWAIGHDAQYEVKFFANVDNARLYINSLRRTSSGDANSRIVAVPSRAWKVSQIDDYAALAKSVPRSVGASDARQNAINVRLMLIANPNQAWEVAQRMFAPRDDATSPGTVQDGWRVEAVPAWNDDAVYYRLKQVENQTLPDHPVACSDILDATLGFGGEIGKLLRASLTLDRVAKARVEITRRIASSRTALYDAIGWPEAVTADDVRRAEDLLLMLDGEKRSESLADSVAYDCGVSPALLEYLRWMGLLQEGGGGTWRVPKIYKALIAPAVAVAAEAKGT